MRLDSNLSIHHNVFIQVRDALTGDVLRRQEQHNITTDAGLNLVRDLLHGGASELTHFALGTDATVPAAGDTALGNEVHRDIITQRGKEAKQLTLNYYLPSGSLNGLELAEAGLFNAASAGTLFARTLFEPINKTSAVTVTFTWVLSFR